MKDEIKGMEAYPIMTVKEEVLKKINNYKKLLFFVNIPLIIGIPVLTEFFMDPIHKETVDKTYITLQMADFFFCFNSIIIYTTIKKVVTSIQYLPEKNKMQIS